MAGLLLEGAEASAEKRRPLALAGRVLGNAWPIGRQGTLEAVRTSDLQQQKSCSLSV